MSGGFLRPTTAIGGEVSGYQLADPALDEFSQLVLTANELIYVDGNGALATSPITEAALELLDDQDATEMLGTLGAEPAGTAAAGDAAHLAAANPHPQYQNGGAADAAIRTVAASGPVVDDDEVVFLDATAGVVTLTLPAASARPGRRLTIKRVSTNANAPVIAGAGGDLIDGDASVALDAPYVSLDLVSDGNAAWYIR